MLIKKEESPIEIEGELVDPEFELNKRTTTNNFFNAGQHKPPKTRMLNSDLSSEEYAECLDFRKREGRPEAKKYGLFHQLFWMKRK